MGDEEDMDVFSMCECEPETERGDSRNSSCSCREGRAEEIPQNHRGQSQKVTAEEGGS